MDREAAGEVKDGLGTAGGDVVGIVGLSKRVGGWGDTGDAKGDKGDKGDITSFASGRKRFRLLNFSSLRDVQARGGGRVGSGG